MNERREKKARSSESWRESRKKQGRKGDERKREIATHQVPFPFHQSALLSLISSIPERELSGSDRRFGSLEVSDPEDSHRADVSRWTASLRRKPRKTRCEVSFTFVSSSSKRTKTVDRVEMEGQNSRQSHPRSAAEQSSHPRCTSAS